MSNILQNSMRDTTTLPLVRSVSLEMPTVGIVIVDIFRQGNGTCAVDFTLNHQSRRTEWNVAMDLAVEMAHDFVQYYKETKAY